MTRCKYCQSNQRSEFITKESLLRSDALIDNQPDDQIFESLLPLAHQIRSDWSSRKIKYRVFDGSATNRLFALYCEDSLENETILFRVHGNQTDLYIDRTSELDHTLVLHQFGLTAHVFLKFNNGVAYEYIEGQVLDYELVCDTDVSDMIAREFARMHNVPLDAIFGACISAPSVATLQQHSNSSCSIGRKTAFLEYAYELFYKSIPERYDDAVKQSRFVSVFESREALRREIDGLVEQVAEMNAPIVFCHNDVVMRNIVLQPWSSSVRFLDWEYAAPNYAAFDIASHFVSFVGFNNADFTRYPGPAFRRRFLRTYLAERARLRALDATRPCNAHNQCELSRPESERSEQEQEQEQVQEPVSDAELDQWSAHVQQFSVHVYFMWILWALVQMNISKLDVNFLDYAVRRYAEFQRVKGSRLGCTKEMDDE